MKRQKKSKVVLREEIAQLREKIKDLQLEASGLRLVTEALWEGPSATIAISYGAPSRTDRLLYPQYCQAVAEEGHRVAEVVDAELKRLREGFRNYEGFAEACTLPKHVIEKLKDSQDKPREIIAWQQKRIKELEERIAAAYRANEQARAKVIDVLNSTLHVW